MPTFKDLTGQRFGRLTVTHRNPQHTVAGKMVKAVWACVCDCGNTLSVAPTGLTSGNTQSCGCLKLDQLMARSRTHGRAKTPEHNVWKTMKQRCLNPKNEDYKDYGGRGVTLCDAWMQFEKFYEDMGPRPSPKHSIDRRDNSKGYEKGNCRWVTKDVQASNTRACKQITMDGVTNNLAGWCRQLGLPYGAILHRLKRGVAIHQALLPPHEYQQLVKNKEVQYAPN